MTSELRIVVPRYGAEVVGGAETAMRRLARELASRGWTVEVFTTTALEENTWRSALAAGTSKDGANVTVHRFEVRFGRRRWLFRQLSRWVFRAPQWLPRPEKLWLLVQGPYAPALVRALSTARPMPTLFSPYLFYPTLQGLCDASPPRILCPAAHDEPPLRLRLVEKAVAAVEGLWFHTPEEADLLRQVHPRAAGIASECGVMGVDVPPDLDVTAFARRHGIEGRYLFHGGRLAGGKGLTELLAGFARLHDVHPSSRLVLSGHVMTDANQPGVIRVGLLDERQRWEAIAGAHAVVAPGRLESLSLLALEAWSAGRPCLVNGESTVLRGHIQRGGGGIAYWGPDDLARAAGRLWQDPALADRLGEQGRSYVSATFRWDLSEERLRRLIAAGST